MTNKWVFKQPIKLVGNENLAKIVRFYMWETPVPGASMKGKGFKELGWTRGFLQYFAQDDANEIRFSRFGALAAGS